MVRPGVHEAAVLAAKVLGNDDTSPEYPYHGTWFSNFLAASAQGKPHRGRPNAYSHWFAKGEDTEGLTGITEKLRHSAEYPQYEKEWVEMMRSAVDAVDVWDPWTLLRMLSCESTSRWAGRTAGLEHEVLRTALYQVC
jgi:hypothetical protein